MAGPYGDPNQPNKRFVITRKCPSRSVAATIDGKELQQCAFSAAMRRYCTFTQGIESRADLYDLTFHHRGVYVLQDIGPPPNVLQFLEQQEAQFEHLVEDDGADDGDDV